MIKGMVHGGGGAGLPLGLLVPNQLVTRIENKSFPIEIFRREMNIIS